MADGGQIADFSTLYARYKCWMWCFHRADEYAEPRAQRECLQVVTVALFLFVWYSRDSFVRKFQAATLTAFHAVGTPQLLLSCFVGGRALLAATDEEAVSCLII